MISRQGDCMNFKILSDRKLSSLHKGTLELLSCTGMEVQCDEALELLKNAGATVKGTRVRIHENLIKWALSTVPSQVILYDRGGKPVLFLGSGNSYWSVGLGPPYVIDPYSKKRRKVLINDVANAAKLMDYLPNIDYVFSLGTVSDCHPHMETIYEFRAELLNTTKPIFTWGHSAESCRFTLEIASVIRGSRENVQEKPFLGFYSEPMPPLRHTREGLEKLLFLAENNIPQCHQSGLIMGASCPVTVAGALVVANAEQLSALVISQLKRKGSPYIYGAEMLGFDMSNGNCSYGAPEMLLTTAGITGLAHYYGLPLLSHAGTTDSPSVCDCQAGLEVGSSILLAALFGVDLVHNLGFVEAAMAGNLELLAICDEYLSQVKRFMRGVEVDREHMALDAIHETGPGGSFLATDHTVRHFRANYFPDLVTRDLYSQWTKGGSKDLYQRANEKVKHILQHHCPEPIPDSAVRKIDKIIEEAEKKLTK